MNNAQLETLKKKYVARGAATATPQSADTALNAEIWDADGTRWIDFAGGIGVLNLGHRHPKIVAAVKAQLDKLMHTAAGVMSHPLYVELSQKLCELTPVRGPERKALLMNSGAEAVENAIKIARAATGRSGVITFDGAFHGRTMMTMALTGKVVPYKGDFGPMPGDVYRAPYPNEKHGISEEQSLNAIRTLFKTDIPASRTAAIILEPVQGEGGFYIASPSFLTALRELCDEHGILLIADEVQSGFARTGKLFAMEHSGVEADIMTMAKSLANGMPLSAVVGTAEVMDASGPGSLGGTYGGNALSCAAALAVIDVIREENILERSTQMGELLAARFAKWEERFAHVAHPRNQGSMAAFELVDANGQPDAAATAAVCAKAKELGLILLSCGFYSNTIRILVPLTVEPEVLEEGLAIIEQALESLA
ncbi:MULTISPECIES: 4-aminobutyrate--2-oxoglutarate transaminase [Cobetia]|uniref:4-aminobutyrate--2-oxoglutarate transaminase n=1 Tax=Cobetia TaxID=204286 RepID=UPI00178CE1C6|nr:MULTISPECIES: 4-aminobutyrate--2-oxoglutarate transaminase [Cobetia]UTV88325.1 4-aminobutyrate--2-oxoglutarate transaminase [Cobetia litoralis]MBE2169205.1 4-aminobutyrate--2-oxoglutarate transaminase [Cobetia sp. 2AS1]MCK8067221.1 4-aminobutyrate--2-oxoglutarate transaminase [Cobetia sp. 1CM21F]MDH2446692.1 4-aminobutyrate--2-oxoglutarate transaminase [Cobetia sp. 2AS]MDO6814753.1 4-aminobutyrate--2-oxoglutarate transaminase [Cobetia amphilecti]